MSLILRAFNPETDLRDQRSLFELSFPETIGSAACTDEHYFWKFSSFPSEIPSYQYVAYEGSQILGYYAAIPFQYRLAGKSYICGMVCDVMTHPMARGKGIFTKLGFFATDDLAKRNIGFTSGYPIRPEVMPGHMKVGWKQVVKLPMFIKVLGTKSFLPSWAQPFFTPVNGLLKLINKVSLSSSQYRVEMYDRSVLVSKKAEINAFLGKWLSEQENALEKNVDFISWRTGAADADYSFALARDQITLDLVGISIVRPTVLKGVDVLAVLDMMILKAHAKSAYNIHRAFCELGYRSKKDAIVAMTTPKCAKDYRFYWNLWVPSPAVFTLIIKKLDSGIADEVLFNPKCWHLFWLDSDDL